MSSGGFNPKRRFCVKSSLETLPEPVLRNITLLCNLDRPSSHSVVSTFFRRLVQRVNLSADTSQWDKVSSSDKKVYDRSNNVQKRGKPNALWCALRQRVAQNMHIVLPRVWRSFKGLSELDLSGNKITNDLLADLSKCETLSYLDLSNSSCAKIVTRECSGSSRNDTNGRAVATQSKRCSHVYASFMFVVHLH